MRELNMMEISNVSGRPLTYCTPGGTVCGTGADWKAAYEETVLAVSDWLSYCF